MAEQSSVPSSGRKGVRHEERRIRRYDTLYDLIMKKGCEIRFVSKEEDEGVFQTVEGVDNFNWEHFVPLMMSLTPGQRALSKIGLSELLLSVTISMDSYVSVFETASEILKPQGTVTGQGEQPESDVPEGTISVYAGVDRTLFDPDGIAMTSEAINRKNGGDESFGSLNMTAQQRPIMRLVAMAAGGVAVTTTTTMFLQTVVPYMSTATKLSSDLVSYAEVLQNNLIKLEVLKQSQFTAMTEIETLESTIKVVRTQIVDTNEKLAQNTFRAALSRTFSQIFTKVMAVLDIIAIIALVVDLVMMLISFIKEDKTDTPYVEIPCILCSVENVFNGRFDENAERIIEPGYVYYYGVKNPDIDRGDVNDKSNVYRHGIGDVYNWTLKGPYREWIALYMTKDQRMGNPIKAESLRVSGSVTEQGYRTLEYFHSEIGACDMMFFYRQTKGDQSLGYKYLHFQTATDEEMKAFEGQTTASVFASGASWAFAGAGLACGLAGGVGLKTVADRKKKKPEETA